MDNGKSKYKSEMEQFHVRDAVYQETREKMLRIAEEKQKNSCQRQFFRLSHAALAGVALFVIVLLIPLTSYAVQKYSGLLHQIFGESKKDMDIISEQVYSSDETIVIGKYRYGIEEYLYDDELHTGFLTYYMERTDGENLSDDATERLMMLNVHIFGTIAVDDIQDKALQTIVQLKEGEKRDSYTLSAGVLTSPADQDDIKTANRLYRKLRFDFDETPDRTTLGAAFWEGEDHMMQLDDVPRKAEIIKLPVQEKWKSFRWKSDSRKKGVMSICVSALGIEIEERTDGIVFDGEKQIAQVELCFKDGTRGSIKELDLLEETSNMRYSQAYSDNNGHTWLRADFSKPVDVQKLKSVIIDGEEYR